MYSLAYNALDKNDPTSSPLSPYSTYIFLIMSTSFRLLPDTMSTYFSGTCIDNCSVCVKYHGYSNLLYRQWDINIGDDIDSEMIECAV